MFRLTWFVWAIGLVVLAMIAGCSGGSGNSATSTISNTGSAAFTIDWPERSRMIPQQAESLVVRITQGEREVAKQIVNRTATPPPQLLFATLPVGTLAYEVSACEYQDGKGAVLGIAQGSLQIKKAERTTISINARMQSSISALVITSQNSELSIQRNATMTLYATAFNAKGEVIPIAPNSITWSSSNPIVAPIDPDTGVVSGKSTGKVTITATEDESNESASTEISISDLAARLTVTPQAGTTARLFECSVSGMDKGLNQLIPVKARWDWENDGVFDTPYADDTSSDHQYEIPGVYVLRVEIKDGQGRTACGTRFITVSQDSNPMMVTITPTPAEGSMGTNFIFRVDASNASGHIKQAYFRWDWDNDGIWDTPFTMYIDDNPNMSIPPIATHQFPSIGTRTVRVQVKELCGRCGIGSIIIKVK